LEDCPNGARPSRSIDQNAEAAVGFGYQQRLVPNLLDSKTRGAYAKSKRGTNLLQLPGGQGSISADFRADR
jgi:hypothetical protein